MANPFSNFFQKSRFSKREIFLLHFKWFIFKKREQSIFGHKKSENYKLRTNL